METVRKTRRELKQPVHWTGCLYEGSEDLSDDALDGSDRHTSRGLFRKISCILESRSNRSVLCTRMSLLQSRDQSPCHKRGLLLYLPSDFVLSFFLVLHSLDFLRESKIT